MRVIAVVFLALFVGFPLEAQAPRRATTNSVTPECRFGTDWAVNKSRPVASDEKLYRLEGGPAVVAQRETPGSSRIVFRRCNVPQGTEAYCSVRGCWIKVCGNDLASPEGWKFPIETLMGAQGPQGQKGDKGDQGLPGQIVYVPTAPTTDHFNGPYKVRGNGFPTWAKWLIGTGVAVGAGLVVANNWPHKDEPKGKPPGGTIGPAFSFSF